LWKQLPHDVLSTKDLDRCHKMQRKPFFELTNYRNSQMKVFVKVKTLAMYEYDAHDLVDFTEEDWKLLI